MSTLPFNDVTLLLQKGISAARAGRSREAQRLLRQVVESDPENEMAWLWLSGLVGTDEQKRTCLERVLQANPKNAYARAGLERLQSSPSKEADLLEARLAAVTGGPVPSSSSQACPNQTGSAKPTIKRLKPSAPTNGTARKETAPVPADQVDRAPSRAKPTPQPDVIETTCPSCDRPISPTADMCPHCYLQFRPMEDFAKPEEPVTVVAPAEPPKSQRKGVLGLLGSIIP